LEVFQDLLSIGKFTPSRYLSAIFEPISRRIAENILKTIQIQEVVKDSKISQLFQLDFALQGAELKPILVKISKMNEEDEDEKPDQDENVDLEGIVSQVLKKLKESRKKLEKIAFSAPNYLARAKRGDAFDNFRFVYNSYEDMRFPNLEREDYCYFDSYPSMQDIKFAVEFERVSKKRNQAINRDLNKRI
jgi:hypothetical protein